MAWTRLTAAPSSSRMLDACDGSLFCVNINTRGATVNPGVYQLPGAAAAGAGAAWTQLAASLTPTGSGDQNHYHVGSIRVRKYGGTLVCVIGNCQVGATGGPGFPVILLTSTDGGVTWSTPKGVGQTGGTGWVNDIAGPNTPAVPWYLLRDLGGSPPSIAPDGNGGSWTGIDLDPNDQDTLYLAGRAGLWKCSNLGDSVPVLYPAVHDIFGELAKAVRWDRRWNGYAYVGVGDWTMSRSSDGFQTDIDHLTPLDGNQDVRDVWMNAATGRIYVAFQDDSTNGGRLQSVDMSDPSVAAASLVWREEATGALATALAANAAIGVCVFTYASDEVVLVCVQNDGVYRRAGGGAWAKIGPAGFTKQTVAWFAANDDGTGRVAVMSVDDGLWVSADGANSWTHAWDTTAAVNGACAVVIDPLGSDTLYVSTSNGVQLVTGAFTASPVLTGIKGSVIRPGPLGIHPDGSALWIVDRNASGQLGYLMVMATSAPGTWQEPPGRTRISDGLTSVNRIDVGIDGRILICLDGQAIRLGMLPASGQSVDLGDLWGGGYDQAIRCAPVTSGVVNAGGDTGGTYHSADHGATWTPTGGAVDPSDDLATKDRSIVDVYPHPTISGRWYRLTKVGLWESDDDGASWHSTMPGGVGPALLWTRDGGTHPRNVGSHAIFPSDGSHIVGGDNGTLWTRSPAAEAAGTVDSWATIPSPVTTDVVGLVLDQDGATAYLSDGANVYRGSVVNVQPTFRIYKDAAKRVSVFAGA